jgi:hypothetical protein
MADSAAAARKGKDNVEVEVENPKNILTDV